MSFIFVVLPCITVPVFQKTMFFGSLLPEAHLHEFEAGALIRDTRRVMPFQLDPRPELPVEWVLYQEAVAAEWTVGLKRSLKTWVGMVGSGG